MLTGRSRKPLYIFFSSSYAMNCSAPWDTPNRPGMNPCNQQYATMSSRIITTITILCTILCWSDIHTHNVCQNMHHMLSKRMPSLGYFMTFVTNVALVDIHRENNTTMRSKHSEHVCSLDSDCYEPTRLSRLLQPYRGQVDYYYNRFSKIILCNVCRF